MDISSKTERKIIEMLGNVFGSVKCFHDVNVAVRVRNVDAVGSKHELLIYVVFRNALLL